MDNYSIGDIVPKYHGSQDVIGVYLFKFDNEIECRSLIKFITNNRTININ